MSIFRSSQLSAANTATPSPRGDGPPPRPTQALPSAIPRRNVENPHSIPKQKPTSGLFTIKEASEEHDPKPIEIQSSELGKESSRAFNIQKVSATARGFIKLIPDATETLATPCNDAIAGIKELILTPSMDAQAPPVRVQILYLFYLAAGGKDTFLNSLHPEVEAFSRTLTTLSDDDRLAYLTALKHAFNRYLSEFQNSEIVDGLESIEKAGNHISNRGIRNGTLRGFSQTLFIFIKNELALSELTKEVVEMIAINSEGNWNDASRALKIIYWAAGGQIHTNSKHPETTICSQILSKPSLHERLEHLQRFYIALKSYLTQTQGEAIGQGLSRLEQQSQNNQLGRLGFSNLKTLLRKEFVELFKELITKNTDVKENGTARALKIIYFTAGGPIHVNPKHPETALYADTLSDLSINERLECLQQFYDVLKSYFTSAQGAMIKSVLSKLTNQREGNDLDHSSFLELVAELRVQLEALDVKLEPT